jgi:site-specific recombinase XerD
MWIEGTAKGEYIRRSLKTGSWERASELLRVIEDSEQPSSTPERKEEPVTAGQAVTEYLADAKARELSEATLYKLDIFFRKQFLSWCKSEGYRLLRELDLPAARSFRSSWKDGAMAKKKKQERLTGFFWFCIRAGWITTNPTHNLGRISVTQAPTDYFTREEFSKLVDSTHLYRESRSDDSIGGTSGTRLRTLLLLMRWSGLRIRDAVTLERTRLVSDNLLLYQAKTGTPVYVPLPGGAVAA